MRVENMTSSKGNKIANQFIIHTEELDQQSGDMHRICYFQSYRSIIVRQNLTTGETQLDEDKWDYSRTTSKYRNNFLGDDTREVKAKIKSGEYVLADLN